MGSSGRSGYSSLFLIAHVGLVLAGFAGLTLAAALAALYLWQERELKRRSSTVLRFRAPSLVTLESLFGRTVAYSLPVLTLGMAVGFARLRHDSQLDPLIVLTVLTWAVYGAFLLLRFGAGWHGRRAAYTTLAGFALVVAHAAQPAHGAFRMSLVLVGTSHRLSPVEVRERIALDLEGAAELARRMARDGERGVPLDL